jgi:head-tail adaptor
MGYGKMNSFIDIISTVPIKDADGFVTTGDNIVASVRAYKEERHGTEKWANMAAFSEATAMFRFRRIPGVTVDNTMLIACGGSRYNIISAEDVRGRGMYVEVMAREVKSGG